MHRTNGPDHLGMTLVEVVVAMALFTVASVAAAHLLVWATRALWASGAATTAVAAANAKMEDLQSLTWRFDPSGNRISASGLTPSPADALRENVTGYVDYLDEDGQPVGAGPSPPASAAFVRRWAIRPLASAPGDTVVLQVLVIPLANGTATTVGHGPGESRLSTVRTRMR